MKDNLVRIFFSLSALFLCGTASSEVLCQSSSLCVQQHMPSWSQMDSAGFNLNGSAVPLLEYVNQQMASQLSWDTGWCVPTTTGMLYRTYAKELERNGRKLNAPYDWLHEKDPSKLIFKSMQLMDTDILGTRWGGGTQSNSIQRLGLPTAFVLGGGSGSLQYGTWGLTEYSFRQTYNKPLILLTVGTFGWGDHAVGVNGTDSNKFIIYDPWGSIYSLYISGNDLTYVQGSNPWYMTSTGEPWGRINSKGVAYDWHMISNYSALPPEAIPTITTQPSSLTLNENQSANLSVVVKGYPAPNLQWYMNGSAISGATGSTLNISSIQRQQAGQYFVIASNSMGSVQSQNADIQVHYRPEITLQPQSISINEGQSTSLNVVVQENPTPSYQWYFNGSVISGANSATLNLNNIQRQQAGSYFVIVTNSAGVVQSQSVDVDVIIYSSPVITSQPTCVVVNEGQSTALNFGASGNPVPSYQWYFNGAAISGANSETLSLNNIQRQQSGSYFVIATNLVGSVQSENVTISVQYAPEITTQPLSVTINESQTTSLIAMASGSPAPTYQWYFNGSAVNHGTTAILNMVSVPRSRAGVYFVVAKNSLGSVQSQNVNVTVNYPPQILTQPLGMTTTEGQQARIAVKAVGIPEPSFQWYFNGTAIALATTPDLLINNIQRHQDGQYHVVVTNSMGTVQSQAVRLSIDYAPEIIVDLNHTVGYLGQEVVLEVKAIGSPAPTYRWKKNGLLLKNEFRNFLSLRNFKKSDAGTYQVQVVNSIGSVFSFEAFVNVGYRDAGLADGRAPAAAYKMKLLDRNGGLYFSNINEQ